jgi:hypothetical protein
MPCELTPQRWGTVQLIGEHRRWLAMLRRVDSVAWVLDPSEPPLFRAGRGPKLQTATLPLVVIGRQNAAERLRWIAEQHSHGPIVALPLAADWPVATDWSVGERATVEQAFREAGATLVLWSPLEVGQVVELANRTFAQAWRTRQQTAPATEWIRELLPWRAS